MILPRAVSLTASSDAPAYRRQVVRHAERAMTPDLVLASSSPRRRDLLARIGVVPARVASPDIDERPRPREVPRAYALRLAQEKAAAVVRAGGEVVIAGDTTVAVGRRIL